MKREVFLFLKIDFSKSYFWPKDISLTKIMYPSASAFPYPDNTY